MEELKYIEKGSALVNGQYRFVSHDQVTSKVHPLLVKHRLLIIPFVEEMKQEGDRTTVKLALVFRNPDYPADAFVSYYYGYGIDKGDKGPGKAISYAYKYGLLKTFCLETGDDPDFDANAVYEPEKCLEFDLKLPIDFTDKDKLKLNRFLTYSSQVMKKHVEDVKREALNKMPEFLNAFRNWNPKKKDD